MRRAEYPLWFLHPLCAAITLAGCSTGPNVELRAAVDRADYPAARDILYPTLEKTDKDDRNYILNRMRLGMVELADGRPRDAEPVFSDTFDLLRRQGINDDKTVAATVLGEDGVIYWKGEPFEQALAFTYIAANMAMLGEWDNARAAAQASLFRLRDFGESKDARGSQSKSPEQVAQEAIRREQRSEGGMEDYLDKGYTPIKTNFALGYLMCAVSNLALAGADPDRRSEAQDNFREACDLAPDLKPVADALLDGSANTLLLVDYGSGPEKVAYGPDGSLSKFQPRTPSDRRRLLVSLNKFTPQPFAAACDVNAMARDHLWNSFEDVRRVKSFIGDSLLIGGTAVALTAENKEETQSLIGLGMILGGALLKSTSHADLRHCEIFPQRTYAAAITVAFPGSLMELAVENDPSSRLAVEGVSPPSTGSLQLIYIRLPVGTQQSWQSAGQVRYSNDLQDTTLPGADLPFILGGRCTRSPTIETLARYQKSGYLTDWTVADLENLYRAEGIYWDADDPASRNRNHVLEGGTTLVPPAPGTTGYARTFNQDHPAYQPRSREGKELAASLRIRQPAAQGDSR